MSFEDELQDNIYEPWRYEYVPLRLIKQHLQQKAEQGWTCQAEKDYTTTIQLEVDKVEQFVTRKQREIESRISHCQRAIQSNHQHAATERSYSSAKETLKDIYFDLEELARFTRYNFMAFQRIITFHDELTGNDTRQLLADLMNDKPLDTQRFDTLLIKLGELDDEASRQTASSSSPTLSATPSVSTMSYFWVHEQNLTQLQAMLLFHLPEKIESQVTTYYLDNPQSFNMYYSRLQRDDGGTEIRLEQMGQDLVVRRDAYQKDWYRIPIEQKAQAYAGSTAQEFMSFDKNPAAFPLTGIVHSYVKQYGLEPTLAMSCNRLWYGQGNENGAIVHLDTNVEFSTVDNDDKVSYKFPYAILEATVPSNTTHLMSQLVEMGLAYEVPAFSAFLHGTASLYAPLSLVPWWMRGDMDVDIRNGKEPRYPNTEWMTYSRNLRRPNSIGYLDRQLRTHRLSAQDARVHALDQLRRTPSFRSASSTPMSAIEREPLKASVVDMEQTKSRKSLMQGGVDPVVAAAIPEEEEQVENGDDDNANGKKKKKKLKVWLEPKVFFANERTFIHWLQFAALILVAALTLLNFGDRISTIAGGVFFGIAMGIALYAFGRFRYRAHQIKTRPMIRYDDIWGPIGLTTLLVGAIIVSKSLVQLLLPKLLMSIYSLTLFCVTCIQQNQALISASTIPLVNRHTSHCYHHSFIPLVISLNKSSQYCFTL